MTALESKLIEFFKKNKSPSDVEVHDFAERLKTNPHKFEEGIYKLLGKVLNPKGSELPDSKMKGKHLELGMEVEKEHYPDLPPLQKGIAKGHIDELGKKYYPGLVKFEDQLKKAASISFIAAR